MFDNQLCLRVFNPNVDISLGFKLCTIVNTYVPVFLLFKTYSLPNVMYGASWLNGSLRVDPL